MQIDINPHTPGPNLDIELKVYNSSGSVIAQTNPSTLLAASLMFAAPSDGTYYLSIDGIGMGDPQGTGYSDYGSVGQYTVSGTISAPSGNQAPIAVADANTVSGTEPLLISFTGSGSSDPDGSIASYSWAFSDGGSASGMSVQHTFSAGSHLATLTVTDNQGFSSSDTLNITVNPAPNTPPTAAASVNTSSGLVPLTVSFSSSGSSDSDGSISSYHWDFGDGGSSNSANPSHTYNSEGSFTATLTVTDDDGASDSDSVVITVDPDPNFIAAPTSLSVSLSGTTASLSWRDNANNETGYRVHRGIESGKGKNKTVSWSVIANLAPDSSSYSDSGLASGTYIYQVEAFHLSASAKSAQVKVSTGKGGGGNGNGKGNKK